MGIISINNHSCLIDFMLFNELKLNKFLTQQIYKYNLLRGADTRDPSFITYS